MSVQSKINELRSKMMRVLNRVGRESVDHLQDTLSTPYPPASTAGNPPHMRTGDLRASVRYEARLAGHTKGTLRIKASVPYAAYLEFGTSKMEPRPFMRPEIARIKAELPDELKDALR